MQSTFDIFRYLIFFPDKIYPRIRDFRLYGIGLLYIAATVSLVSASSVFQLGRLRGENQDPEFYAFSAEYLLPGLIGTALSGLLYYTILFIWAKVIIKSIKPRDIAFIFKAAAGLALTFLLPFNLAGFAIHWFAIAPSIHFPMAMAGFTLLAFFASLYGQHQIIESNHRQGFLKAFLVVIATGVSFISITFLPWVLYVATTPLD